MKMFEVFEDLRRQFFAHDLVLHTTGANDKKRYWLQMRHKEEPSLVVPLPELDEGDYNSYLESFGAKQLSLEEFITKLIRPEPVCEEAADILCSAVTEYLHVYRSVPEMNDGLRPLLLAYGEWTAEKLRLPHRHKDFATTFICYLIEG